MPQPFIESHIRRLLLFERLPDDQLEMVANAFQVLRFEPGEVVFHQGQPGQGLYYFVSGRGLLTHREPDPSAPGGSAETPVGEVKTNEFVGEQALFGQTIEPTTLRIVESAIVLFLSRDQMTALVIAYPALRTNLGFQRGDQHSTVKPLFKGQRPDEVVLQVFRRHWWSYARFAWIPLLLASALIVSAFMFIESPALALSMVGLALIVPAGLMYFFYVEWQDDSIIVTNQRAVRLINRWFGLESTISEIPLDRVSEVTVTRPPADPAARFFKYGTVTVRTSGDVGHLSLTTIADPNRIRKLIFTYRDQVRQSVSEQNRREIQAQVDRVLGLPPSDAPLGTVVAQAPPSAPKEQGWVNPLRTKFINQEGQTVYRRHYTVWMRHVILPTLFIAASILFFGVSLFYDVPGLGNYAVVLAPVLIVVGLVWWYLADWDWRYDQFILGEEVLAFIHKRPLWLQDIIDQIRLEKVDSVVSNVQGVINKMLDRGTVEISLIGSDMPKLMDNVHKPKEIQGEISQRLSSIRTNAEQNEAQRQREAIAQYLAVYHEKIAGLEELNSQNASASSIARDASAQTRAMPPPEPPPQPIRDAVRPPRIPRSRPGE